MIVKKIIIFIFYSPFVIILKRSFALRLALLLIVFSNLFLVGVCGIMFLQFKSQAV